MYSVVCTYRCEAALGPELYQEVPGITYVGHCGARLTVHITAGNRDDLLTAILVTEAIIEDECGDFVRGWGA